MYSVINRAEKFSLIEVGGEIGAEISKERAEIYEYELNASELADLFLGNEGNEKYVGTLEIVDLLTGQTVERM